MALNLPAGWSYDATTGILTVPEGTTTINTGFRGNTEITKVIIPEGIITINPYAFNGCTSLTEIVFSGSVTSIGAYAFNGCTSLTEIVIPGSVTSIGAYAFNGCTLHDIYYTGTEKQWNGFFHKPKATRVHFHEYAPWIAVPGYASTCIEPGLSDGVKCSACDIWKTPQDVIPALGHSYGPNEIAVKATPKSAGVLRCTCVRCDYHIGTKFLKLKKNKPRNKSN